MTRRTVAPFDHERRRITPPFDKDDPLVQERGVGHPIPTREPEPQQPPARSAEARITEAVVFQLRGITVSNRIRVKHVHVKPIYSIDNDSELLEAEVNVRVSLIGPFQP